MERDELEGEFYEYLHRMGEADPEWNLDVLRSYVSYFTECDRVLDVGCGEGDFIRLLESTDVEAVGVDADGKMVEVCREKGLDVIEADLFEYLPAHLEQFDGIFSSNLVEHLPAGDAVRFVQLAYEALKPGGRFLVTTPNPASLVVHLREFWRDATHVRLYDRSLLAFMLDWAGFVKVRSSENPATSWEPSGGLRAVPNRMEELRRLRRQIRWTTRIDQPTRLSVEGLHHGVGEAKRGDSTGKGDGSEGGLSWSKRISGLVVDGQERPFLRRLLSSLRRLVARFLVDRVLFEEFRALEEALSDLERGSIELSQAVNRNSAELTKELVKVNQSLSSKFLTLIDLSTTSQRIKQALYQSQNGLLVTPREIFAVGEKPDLDSEATE